jgi:hypothetical protein
VARYRNHAGKEHARHFAKKVGAQRWLDEVSASVLTGQYVDPSCGLCADRRCPLTGKWQVSGHA